MDNSSHIKTVMMAAVGLLLTGIIITLYLSCFQRIKNSTDAVEQREKTQMAQIENYAITRYDKCYIYGSQAISFLKSNWDAFKKVSLNGYEIPDTYNLRNIDDPSYINSNNIYFVEVEEDNNGVPNIVTITLVTNP